MRGRVEGGPGTTDPDRWLSIDTTLRNLVLRAYGLKDYQFAGPAWAEERRFDIEAKLPRGTDMARFRVMLQTLLEERFKLKCHFERKEILAGELTIAKGGAKLKESRPDIVSGPALSRGSRPVSERLDRYGFPILPPGATVSMSNGRSRCHFARIGMAEFATMLSAQINQPVFDLTGLAGEYEIDLYWINEERLPPAGEDSYGGPNGPAIVAALKDQLGLKLENRKRTIDVLALDGALRVPTEN